jgi:ABC-type glutathione transport system ATPase component
VWGRSSKITVVESLNLSAALTHPAGDVGHPDLTDGYDLQIARAGVVGNGGGGKSALARALAERHDPVCCLLGNL